MLIFFGVDILPVEVHSQAQVLHPGETQRVEADPQDGGPGSVLDLPEDPVPLPVRLVEPVTVSENSQ